MSDNLHSTITIETDAALTPQPKKLRDNLMTGIRLLLILILAAAVISLIIVSTKDNNIQDLLLDLITWIKQIPPVYGCAVLVVICVVFSLLMIPATIVNLAGGFLFGIWFGTLAVTVGCMIAAVVAFYLGKTCLRNWVEGLMNKNPKLKAIDKAVEKNAFLIIFLSRLSPAFPFNMLNYAFGVTRASILVYTVSTFLGVFPGVALYCYLGSQLENISDIISNPNQSDPLQIASMVVGLVVTVIVMVVVTVITRRALDAATKELEEEQAKKGRQEEDFNPTLSETNRDARYLNVAKND